MESGDPANCAYTYCMIKEDSCIEKFHETTRPWLMAKRVISACVFIPKLLRMQVRMVLTLSKSSSEIFLPSSFKQSGTCPDIPDLLKGNDVREQICSYYFVVLIVP